MPRFRHVDFSFEIKDPWWIKAEIAGYRLSQYDEFWESVIVRGSFRTDLDRAANGEVVKVPLHDIKQYGDRNAWSGNVCVQGDTIVPHSRGTLAAHARSLGNVLAGTGTLAEWPETVFCFAIDKIGETLTMRRSPGDRSMGVPRRVHGTARYRRSIPAPTASPIVTDCMHELESGRLHRFGDWPIESVPESPGVYTIWDQAGQFLYVGKAKTGGLFGRLKSHANGRRGGDQFSVYVADRFVLRLLTPERIAQISAGTLRFDELVRDYTRDRLGFRFSPTTDADSIEDAIRAGRWPHGKRPMLNPK